MRRKRGLIILGVVAGVLALLIGGLYWAGRSLFYEPTAKGVDSVIGEIGGTRVLGIFAHPDDEQTVNGLFWRAKDRDGAYTAMITATRGEAGEQSPVDARALTAGLHQPIGHRPLPLLETPPEHLLVERDRPLWLVGRVQFLSRIADPATDETALALELQNLKSGSKGVQR